MLARLRLLQLRGVPRWNPSRAWSQRSLAQLQTTPRKLSACDLQPAGLTSLPPRTLSHALSATLAEATEELTQPRADARLKFAPEFLVDPVALQPRLRNVLAVLLRAACSTPPRRHGGHAAMPLSSNG